MNYDIGTRIGDYEILQIIGAGGMGKVFKVRNVISDRIEAMKILLPSLDGNADLAERFIREIKVQASLNHPNIANLHTALSVENQLIMLMEYVEGKTLDVIVKDGPIPIEHMTNYAMQALDALAYAHSKGIVHRDLKPSNMMVTTQGQVKLLDFGIAKLANESSLTKAGLTLGSIYYMSPEQIQGAATLDARADIYSFGVCLYELFTARRPFDGDSEFSIMTAHLNEVPIPPIQRDPRLPAALNDVIMMAIEKDPAKRFQAAGAMLGALRATNRVASPEPPPVAAAKPGPAAAPPPRPPVVNPLPAASAAAASRPSGRRGLYMALGSLATVGVLVLAAIEVPKRMKAKAQDPPVIETSVPIPSNPPPVVTDPATPSQPEVPLPASQTNTPVATSTGTSSTATTTPAVSQPVKSFTSQSAGRSPVATQTPSSSSTPAQQFQAGQASSSAGQPAVVPAAPPGPNPAELARQASLTETREHLMLLGTRATTVKTGVNNLRAEQNRLGLGLRGDISSSLQRMEYFLDQTEDALKRGDAEAAKKNLSSAERETGKLESFLGH